MGPRALIHRGPILLYSIHSCDHRNYFTKNLNKYFFKIEIIAIYCDKNIKNMNKLLHIATLFCLLIGCCYNASSQLVYPPAGLPEEIWDMTYYDYRGIVNAEDNYKYTRPVTFVWDKNTLYVKGIFSDYADSWIKATVSGNEITFDDSQIICEEEFILGEYKSIYGMSGKAYHTSESGHTFLSDGVSFSPCDPKFMMFSKYILSNDRTSLISKYSQSSKERTCAFWYNTHPWVLNFYIWYSDSGEEGTGFPEVDFPTNVSFKKVRGGIGTVMESENTTESITYDMAGRQVNPDHLAPGIYIRNGEKFIVR